MMMEGYKYERVNFTDGTYAYIKNDGKYVPSADRELYVEQILKQQAADPKVELESWFWTDHLTNFKPSKFKDFGYYIMPAEFTWRRAKPFLYVLEEDWELTEQEKAIFQEE